MYFRELSMRSRFRHARNMSSYMRLFCVSMRLSWEWLCEYFSSVCVSNKTFISASVITCQKP